MKEYETVYITKPSLTDTEVSQLNDRVKAIVEKYEGRFFYARNMGKRTLAYPIAKETKGIYYCLDYASGGNTVSDIERMFRLNENVIRYLTVLKSDDVDVEARAAEIAAKGEDAPAAAYDQDLKEYHEAKEFQTGSFDSSEEGEEKPNRVNDDDTNEKTE